MIITVFNEKGGAGKSTTALNLWGELCKSGKKVAIVDTDSGGRALNAIANVAGEDSDLRKSVFRAEASDYEYFKNLLSEIYNDFEIIIIDTPPRYGEEFNVAQMVCDAFIVPAKTSLQDRALSVKTATMLADDRLKRKTFILPTAISINQQMSKLALDDFNGVEGVTVLPHIRQSTTLEKAIEFGLPVCMFDPDSQIANDWQASIQQLQKEIA